MFLFFLSIYFFYYLYLLIYTEFVYPEMSGGITSLCHAEPTVKLAGLLNGLLPGAALLSEQVHLLEPAGGECFDGALAVAWLQVLIILVCGAIFLVVRSKESKRAWKVTTPEKYFAALALVLLFILGWGLGVGAGSTTTFDELPDLVIVFLLTVFLALYLVVTGLSLSKKTSRI